jgi:hypothetical protein
LDENGLDLTLESAALTKTAPQPKPKQDRKRRMRKNTHKKKSMTRFPQHTQTLPQAHKKRQIRVKEIKGQGVAEPDDFQNSIIREQRKLLTEAGLSDN